VRWFEVGTGEFNDMDLSVDDQFYERGPFAT
jgi:hypothetical protein